MKIRATTKNRYYMKVFLVSIFTFLSLNFGRKMIKKSQQNTDSNTES